MHQLIQKTLELLNENWKSNPEIAEELFEKQKEVSELFSGVTDHDIIELCGGLKNWNKVERYVYGGLNYQLKCAFVEEYEELGWGENYSL